MAFANLLEQVGGMGRFQVLSVLLLSLPVLMMASHNLLQNFTAASSDHRCRLLWEDNATNLSPEDLLKVSVPQGERCRRFVTPQWWLLEVNGSTSNASWPETEPCHDGWTYDRSVFTSTIITEVGWWQGQGGRVWGPNSTCRGIKEGSTTITMWTSPSWSIFPAQVLVETLHAMS
ncbi:PREDICTED: solute carrier family 22 member 11-like [Acanthisitta chloris]|uniref:solute carrier family 22 member 11-like n=1 Tax=Acanthisitta chloris TaxID=57068 RepID=UPI0004F0D471|nr:PREDICTED: solute carrier family 22 member 11-like [Acanthisitta chloris]